MYKEQMIYTQTITHFITFKQDIVKLYCERYGVSIIHYERAKHQERLFISHYIGHID